MENQLEIWKDIPEYEGYYQVSNLGRVKSFKKSKETILKSGTDTSGYHFVVLYKDAKPRTIPNHKLVAIVFLNHIRCGNDLVVNHKNFIRTDNRLENLEVITHRENANKKHIKSSSIYTGVSWHKNRKKWQTRINVKGEIIHIGYFVNEVDAHHAYEEKLKTIINPNNIPKDGECFEE